MKKAIVVGATSGIGRALAVELARNGYSVGAAGRRTELLEQLQQQLGALVHTKRIDVSRSSEAIALLEELINDLGGLDLIILSSGTFADYSDNNWNEIYEREQQVIATNILGYTAMANVAVRRFVQQGHGHLVGISSIAALRGYYLSPAYSGSKAFNTIYLESLRHRFIKMNLNITVTDVLPGLVDTPMAKSKIMFWVASPEEAARQIYRAIVKKKPTAYVTKRWGVLAKLMKWTPEWIYLKM